MSSLLQQQLGLYEHASETATDEFRDAIHERLVIERRQLSRLLEFGMFLFDQICRIDGDWSGDAIKPQPGNTAVESATEIGRLYQWWCRPCTRLLSQIASLESKGYPLHIAEKFREACAAARTKSAWDINRITSADAEFKQGSGREMDEVFDELQGRPATPRD